MRDGDAVGELAESAAEVATRLVTIECGLFDVVDMLKVKARKLPLAKCRVAPAVTGRVASRFRGIGLLPKIWPQKQSAGQRSVGAECYVQAWPRL